MQILWPTEGLQKGLYWHQEAGFVPGEHPNKHLINEQGVKALAPHSLPQLRANDFWEEQLGTILWGRWYSWAHVPPPTLVHAASIVLTVVSESALLALCP